MRDRAFVLSRAMPGALLTLALAAAPACAPATARNAAPAPCPGNVQLVVRNNTGGPLDIYRNAVGRPFVATVPPGTSNIPLDPEERGGGYLVFTTPGSAQPGQYVGTANRTRGNQYHIEEHCVP